MCRWVSAVVAVTAFVFAPAAAAGNPVAALYNDFASDGVLSCHSKADLRAVLADATLQQYGDPSTMIGLKLAAHKQLAGGCRHPAQSSSPSGSSPPTAQQRSQGTPSKKDGKNSRSERPRASAAAPPARASTVEEPTDERMLLGGGLLMLTLATGGWAARRAFNGKR